jgi:nucleotide-binding universal stress UspA family protein
MEILSMLNILVPTDFSKLSKVAVQYAIKIGNKLDGNITLFHVVTVTKAVRHSMRDKMKDLENDMMEKAESDLNKLMKEICKSVKTSNPVKCMVVRSDAFQETLMKYAKKLRTGLIVMGTKGASGLKKTVVGSNTTSVIEKSKIPVLAVPDKAVFNGFKDIVYASDLKQTEKEIKTLLPYVEKFDSVLHLVHVAKNGINVEEVEEKIDSLVRKTGYENMVTLVLVDRDVDGAIDQYLQVSKADILAMFTHNLNFYEKLFEKSKTREMAFHSRVPLLAFKTR